jgi:putative ABC transport system substrate-binding protein
MIDIKISSPDIIFSIGTPAMIEAINCSNDCKIVFTKTFTPDQLNFRYNKENVYGIYNPLFLDQFIELIKLAVPDLKKIGLPFDGKEINSQFAKKMMELTAVKKGIILEDIPYSDYNSLTSAINTLCDHSNDAICIIANNSANFNMKSISNICSEKKMPLFIADPYQAEKGATFGFGVKADTWGREAAEIVIELLKYNKVNDEKIRPAKKYDLMLNTKAALEQGVTLSPELIKKSERILE